MCQQAASKSQLIQDLSQLQRATLSKVMIFFLDVIEESFKSLAISTPNGLILLGIFSPELSAKLDEALSACISVWFLPLPNSTSFLLSKVLTSNKHVSPKILSQHLLLERPIHGKNIVIRWLSYLQIAKFPCLIRM